MKFIITTLSCLVLTLTTYAQAPQKMTYQAVVRDASNTLIANSTVGVQISILAGSSTGPAS